ncbi:MAG: hypothetical protein IJ662_09105 [Clostridia bacterium]|nr:hypothetical protein [Clostridia bacterium]
MKRLLALFLILVLSAVASQALAAEITEEHFPGYYVALNTTLKKVQKMAKDAGWHKNGPIWPRAPINGFTFYTNKVDFTYEGDESASFYIIYRDDDPQPICGSHYRTYYASGKEAKAAFEPIAQWLEEHFGSAPIPPSKDYRDARDYLVTLDDQLMKVTVGYRNYNGKPCIVFEMLLADNPEDALAEYGYQSKEDVPVVTWVPMGIEKKGK